MSITIIMMVVIMTVVTTEAAIIMAAVVTTTEHLFANQHFLVGTGRLNQSSPARKAFPLCCKTTYLRSFTKTLKLIIYKFQFINLTLGLSPARRAPARGR
jgi:hypothetical protein